MRFGDENNRVVVNKFKMTDVAVKCLLGGVVRSYLWFMSNLQIELVQ